VNANLLQTAVRFGMGKKPKAGWFGLGYFPGRFGFAQEQPI
jgi:hypothetical protein